ncbi:hypothetical protein [Horticoccus sp. 23ND18S-11]|uniref:hypothetical protein n=1 Tax=Horticoccus sp. 23ND18S-11 TaxID=3391832 RepID=UPI0039C91643
MCVEKNLIALRDFLGRLTRSSIVSGSGWTFVDEIKQLDSAVLELQTLRNGLEKVAKVIEAGEHDRRELVERVASLTRAIAAKDAS